MGEILIIAGLAALLLGGEGLPNPSDKPPPYVAPPNYVIRAPFSVYDSFATAVRQCQGPVVWVDGLEGPNVAYHVQGSHAFEATKDGKYACQKDAETAGVRRAKDDN